MKHSTIYGIYFKSKPELYKNKKCCYETHYQVLRTNTGPTNTSGEGTIYSIKPNLILKNISLQ